MRICVFGAGSLGSALGGLLAEKHEITIVGRTAHIQAVKQKGLALTGERSGVVMLEATDSLDGIPDPELLVMTIKAYNTKEAVAACAQVVGEDTRVITLQNGLGNLEMLRSWKGPRAFGGTTTMGATLLREGTVKISGVGRVVVGGDVDPDGAKTIADAFAASGIQSVVKEDIVSELWGKAVVNACINPVTAILGVLNGELLRNPVVNRLLESICMECEGIARAAGAKNLPSSMIDLVRRVAADTADNRSSMLRDVELGRRTEISHINGMFCKHGTLLGLPTPLNRALMAMVESLATMRKVNIVT